MPSDSSYQAFCRTRLLLPRHDPQFNRLWDRGVFKSTLIPQSWFIHSPPSNQSPKQTNINMAPGKKTATSKVVAAAASSEKTPIASAVAEGKLKKIATTSAGGIKKRRPTKPNNNGYSTYIYKVLKTVHPDTGISSKGMRVMDGIVRDVLQRIATEAGNIARANHDQTLSARHIQTAVRLTFKHELAKHAVSEGTKAVTKYNSTLGSSEV